MSKPGSNGGLKGSMWASSGRTHTHTYTYRPDQRPRSTSPTKTAPHEGTGGDTSRSSSRSRNGAHPTQRNGVPSSSSSFLTPAPAPTIAAANNRMSSAGGGGAIAPRVALHRLEQTCLRLRWKSIDLDNAWQRAQNPGEGGWSPEHAEGNFKVDFYEFYAWIEQALVLLQRIFGVEISSGRGGVGGGGGGGGWSRQWADHSFHHNVLAALEDEDNPLRGVLGTGEVRHALWKAKELRNRWKDAAAGERETPPLRMYDLRWIVVNILGGLESAYGVATDRVRRLEAESQLSGATTGGAAAGDEGWDWMVESMDWEA